MTDPKKEDFQIISIEILIIKHRKQAVAELVPSSRLVQIQFRFSEVKLCTCILHKLEVFDQMMDQSKINKSKFRLN